MTKKILVVIDTQYDFMMSDGALPVPDAESLITPLNKFVTDAATNDDYVGIIFTHDTHNPEEYAASEEAKLFPVHCVLGTPGWSNVINPSLTLDKGWILRKGVFNMWEESDVFVEDLNDRNNVYARDDFFNDNSREVEVVGVAADYCVKWALEGFVERGFNTTVITDLTRGIDRNIMEVVLSDFAHKPLRMRSAFI